MMYSLRIILSIDDKIIAYCGDFWKVYEKTKHERVLFQLKSESLEFLQRERPEYKFVEELIFLL